MDVTDSGIVAVVIACSCGGGVLKKWPCREKPRIARTLSVNLASPDSLGILLGGLKSLDANPRDGNTAIPALTRT